MKNLTLSDLLGIYVPQDFKKMSVGVIIVVIAC